MSSAQWQYVVAVSVCVYIYILLLHAQCSFIMHSTVNILMILSFKSAHALEMKKINRIKSTTAIVKLAAVAAATAAATMQRHQQKAPFAMLSVSLIASASMRAHLTHKQRRHRKICNKTGSVYHVHANTFVVFDLVEMTIIKKNKLK